MSWFFDHILYFLLAIGVVISIFWVYNFRKELRIKWYANIIINILIVATGVASAMLFARLENAISGSGDGNMSIYGAIFATPLCCLLGTIVFRRKKRMTMDVLTFPIVIAATLARVNCLIKGCCLGLEIDGTNFRYPTREAELVFDVIFLIVIARMTAKKQFKGYNYPLYLISYGLFRFIIQWFRAEGFCVIGSLTLSHIWSILSVTVGLVILLLLIQYNKKNHSNRKKQ
ncbi:MAG: prolipoprotein diacylglyceryl transferase [Ruminococcus sp.]|nr:prolipoprotein diacylglyceryl transferase [Ruminococcus sp.]